MVTKCDSIDFNTNGFFRMSSNIIDTDEEIRTVDIAVYGVLSKFAGNESKEAYPRLTTIAEMARCSESTARRSISNLRKLGFVSVERRKDDRGYQTSNKYVILNV